ncbi:MAG TPA: right-handed parallel beta-helix repeat-containing protein [Chiayiivirga sp.]|nr:right-handed parallel beta-helix repeat-containing protein [Chiayiivirga sp.]
MSHASFLRLALVLLIGWHGICTAHANPIILWVTNSNNFGPGSFSAALAQLQPVATPQEIRFAFPSTQTIYLNGPQSAIVGTNVRIDGSDMFGNVVIDGAGWTPISVGVSAATTTLTVANLTLRHGQVIGKGGCVSVLNPATTTVIDHVKLIECKAFVDASTPARGGAVFAAGPLTVLDSIFERNEVRTVGAGAETADAHGGAIASEGAHDVNIVRSVFTDNRVYLFNSLPSWCASGAGGAVMLYLPGATPTGTITDSTFIGNHTACQHPSSPTDAIGTGDGGALSLHSDGGIFRIERNFFEANTGRRGGAIGVINAGSTRLDLISNTFKGNRGLASSGGVGLVNCCYVTMVNNTFSANRSGADGFPNQYGGAFSINSGTLLLANNIIDNAGGPGQSCSYHFGQVTSSHNLYSDAACPIPNPDPTSVVTGPMSWLGAPVWLGGSVLVMPPDYGSPAIDTGDDARCALYDARGSIRPLDGNGDGIAHCDVGALEGSRVMKLFKDGFEATP